MIVKATHLRKNIYSILDQVLETGKPVQIERNGRVLTIEPDKRPSKISRLKKTEGDRSGSAGDRRCRLVGGMAR